MNDEIDELEDEEEEDGEWPDYDGEGDEDDDDLPAQEGDDGAEVDIDELCDRLLSKSTSYSFFEEYLKAAMEWLEDEETTENLHTATAQLARDLRSHWSVQIPDWLEESLADLNQAFEKDDGESMVYILLHIQKELLPT